MKRLAMATVVLTALAVGAQAGDLPKPIRLVDRMKMYSPTHYVRGAEAGGGGGGSSSEGTRPRRGRRRPPPKPADQPKPDPEAREGGLIPTGG